MGSNQSRLDDGRWGLRLPRRSASHCTQPELKTRKSPGLTVNSGGQYRHLNCTNDSSARSSPSDDLSFAHDTKGRIASKNNSSVTFCPCFHRSKQAKHRGATMPDHSCDSVALLRLTGQSDRRCPSPADLGCDGSSLQEKPDQILDGVSSEENLSTVSDGRRITGASHDETGCAGLVLSCDDDDDDIQHRTVLSKGWADRNENAQTAQKRELEDIGFRNEEWAVEKKCPSFNLSDSSKSKSELDQFSSGGRLTESGDFAVGVKKNSETFEPDHTTSTVASYVDSGKASEMAASVDLCYHPNGIKAPIAKIDSLETTSIDSFDSDEFTIDATAYSHKSIGVLGVGKISDPSLKSVAPSSIHEAGNLNSASVRSEECLKDIYPGDATIDVMLNLVENPNAQKRAKGCQTVEKERRHLSCPVPGTSILPVNGNSVLSVPSDAVNVSRGNHSLSSVFLELPDWQTVSNEECITLSRRMYSDLCSETEAVRMMLLHLGTLLVHQDHRLEDDDSRNNNLVDPVAYKDCNPFLQSGEIRDNAYLMHKLLSKNLNLKKQIALLETVASEQQEFILTLQQKLHRLQNSAPKSYFETLAEVDSVSNFTQSKFSPDTTITA